MLKRAGPRLIIIRFQLSEETTLLMRRRSPPETQPFDDTGRLVRLSCSIRSGGRFVNRTIIGGRADAICNSQLLNLNRHPDTLDSAYMAGWSCSFPDCSPLPLSLPGTVT